MKKKFLLCSQRQDTNRHGFRVDGLENAYVRFFESFGVELIAVPNQTSGVENYFQLPIQGLLLTGGNNVCAERYNENSIDPPSTSPERDSLEEALLKTAVEKKMKVLGVCRGMQFINVFFGGRLTQSLKKNHVAKTHKVRLSETRLQTLSGNDAFTVNSYHDQGILTGDLSPTLKAFAQSDDDVVEGLYHPTLPIAAIQWHPERESSSVDLDRALVESFLSGKLYWS